MLDRTKVTTGCMGQPCSHRRPFQGLGPREWQKLGLAALLAFYTTWVGMEIIRNNLFLWIVGADYLAFWSAGYAANRWGYSAIYNLALMGEIQASAVAPTDSSLVVVSPMQFLYLPIFVLPFQILAMIPLKWSMLVWSLLNLGGISLYLRFFTRSGAQGSRPGHLLAMLLLSYPAFLNLVHGQMSYFLAICIGEFLRQMRAGHPFRAGLWLGGLLLKPQSLLLIIPALAIQRMWNALLGAATVAILIIAASFGLAGPHGLRQLFELWVGCGTGWLGNNPEYMTNWRMVGTHLSQWIPSTLAWTLSLIGLIGTAGAGLFLWRRPLSPPHSSFAIAMLGTLAATAAVSWHTHPHMLVILIAPIASLYLEGELSERMLSLWTFALPPAALFGLVVALLAQWGVLALYPRASVLPEGITGLFLNLYLLIWAFQKLQLVRISS